MAAEDRLESTPVLTFLIADVRGYTRYTAEEGDEAGARLALAFAREAGRIVAEQQGTLVETRGDEILAVFHRPDDAVQAALQMAGTSGPAAGGLPLPAGIGLDCGPAVAVGGGYRGLALNVAARLCALAAPGEILATDRTALLLRRTDGLRLLERGRPVLKGISDPVRVVRIVPADEAADAAGAPPVTAGPTNLGPSATSFIGRERELAEVTALFRPDVRLVTLTGMGGTGKTRLAIEAGRLLLPRFERGVYLVPLAGVTLPAGVLPAIASALAIREEPDRPIAATLAQRLADCDMLLILDNFEHVLPAANDLAGLLAACPRLNLLVTSRSVLHLSGEHDYPVPPLPLPRPGEIRDPRALARNDAVQLFCRRAEAARSGFRLTSENAEAIAAICIRLDGLPLAIELAAARIRLFPPPVLRDRLTNRLGTLTGGPRDLPERQQTLRATIDWSYSLLNGGEQETFAGLSVFQGGASLDAVEAVAGDDAIGTVEALVEHSLLSQEGEEDIRLVMLETVREFAGEVLAQREDQEDIHRRHAEFFAAVAEEADGAATGPGQSEALARLDREHDNLLAALDWTLRAGESDLALRIAVPLTWYWDVRGLFAEGMIWSERVLTLPGSASALRAELLIGAASLRLQQGDIDRAEALYREELAVRQALNDARGVAIAVNHLGITARARGDAPGAVAHFEEALALAHAIPHPGVVALVRSNLATTLLLLERYDEADAHLRESLAHHRGRGHYFGVVHQLVPLALLALERDDLPLAVAYQREALLLCRTNGFGGMLTGCLRNAGRIAVVRGDAITAWRLWGAADAQRVRLGQREDLEAAGMAQRYLDLARARLAPEHGQAAYAAGQVLEVDAAVDEALSLLVVADLVNS